MLPIHAGILQTRGQTDGVSLPSFHIQTQHTFCRGKAPPRRSALFRTGAGPAHSAPPC